MSAVSEGLARKRFATRRLVAAGAVGIVGSVASALFGWGRAKGLALTLHPSGIGEYGQLWAFVLYAGTVGALGIGVGSTSLIAGLSARKDVNGLRAVTRLSVGIAAVFGTALALLVAVFAGPASHLVLGHTAVLPMLLAAASLPFVAIQLPLQHVLQGFEDVVGQTVIYTIYGAVFTTASILGAVLGGLDGAVTGLAIGNIALAALSYLRSEWHLARAGASGKLSRKDRVWVRPLVAVGAASLVMSLAWGAADLAVRTALLRANGAAAAGYWFALLTISVQMIGVLAGAMSYFTAPLAAHAFATLDRTRARALLDNSLRFALLALVPPLLVLTALRRFVTPLLFSGSFAEVAHVLPVQLSGDIIRTIGWTLGVALVPLGLTRAWLAIGLGTSLLYAGVGIAFADAWSVMGAAEAWVICWAFSSIATAVVLLRAGWWTPTRRLGGTLLIAAIGLASAAAFPGFAGLFLALAASFAYLLAATTKGERHRVARTLRARAKPGRRGTQTL